MVTIAVDAARSSKSYTDNLTSRSGPIGDNPDDAHPDVHRSKVRPAAIATWRFGEIAVDAAKDLLEDGATALDALEAGTWYRATCGDRISPTLRAPGMYAYKRELLLVWYCRILAPDENSTAVVLPRAKR